MNNPNADLLATIRDICAPYAPKTLPPKPNAALIVNVTFRDPRGATATAALNWHDRAQVREFAAQANAWLRNGPGYSVTTEAAS